jgi:hypothetical protein
MTKSFLLCIFLITGVICFAQDKNGLATITDLDPQENLIKPFKGRLEDFNHNYNVGDLNGDMQKDSAFVSYKRVLSPKDIYEKECGQNVCYSRIQFSSKIPDMIIEAYSIDVKAVGDINGDSRDDILLFLETNMYNWGEMRLYSYYNNKWTLWQYGPAFLSDDKDYENRIVKSGKNYYLMQDVWNKDYSDFSRKKLKIKKGSKQNP